MKFAHLGDCHLGGWRQPELKELNFKSFQYAIDKCIKEKVDFVLITGDLFDSAYPPIETLKETFNEFRKLKEEKIQVFLIAGSHDYSVSGKSFLDVLEKSGFCKNVGVYEERDGKIILEPTIYRNVAIYGYPGRKSGLETADIERIKILGAPGLFRILMLHTAIRDAVKDLPIDAVDETKLPTVDYLALGHLHIDYSKDNRVYSGALFPNSLPELAEIKYGTFYIFDNGKLRKETIKLKEVLFKFIQLSSSFNAAEKIIEDLEKESISNKIVIIKLYGLLEQGKISDINFPKIEAYLKQRGAYLFLKSTSKLHLSEQEIKLDIQDSVNLEDQIIKKFEDSNPSRFNELIPSLLKILQSEKLEDERSLVFEERLMSEAKKILST